MTALYRLILMGVRRVCYPITAAEASTLTDMDKVNGFILSKAPEAMAQEALRLYSTENSLSYVGIESKPDSEPDQKYDLYRRIL